jgi:polyhydroxyalkanoate synthase subunit PhaC
MTAAARHPDRRLAPLPLPLHLASASLLWLTSRAALTSWPNGWPLSKVVETAADGRLAALVDEVALLGREAVGAALDRELHRRADLFLTGLEAYRRHPYRRRAWRVPVLWRGGAARLLDYGKGGAAPAVLIVPSLINRHYILDLLPERSFARHLAARGLRPLVLDWGAPGRTERDFTLSDYIAGPLAEALAAAVDSAGRSVTLLGYCMGGLLSLALALRRPADIACLALLATPWDFHAAAPEQARLLATVVEGLPLYAAAPGPLPVPVIQTLFAALDPFLAERKFVRFAGLDPQGAAARDFVALEDWINDGVPLARNVALECARSWYRDNQPARGLWQVAGQPIRPEGFAKPALVVLPSRDRIVPPASAEPLAAAIPGATVLRPPFGHIGMMASTAAPETVWQPIADWLRAGVGNQ